jgi:FkbM family methyltransferase
VSSALIDGLRAFAVLEARGAPTPVLATKPVPAASTQTERLEWLFDHLVDDHSRQQLVELVRWRVYGPSTGRSRADQGAHQRRLAAIDRDHLVVKRIHGSTFHDVNLYRIPGKHGPIEVRASRNDILGTFVVERFAYEREGVTIRAGQGNVVIDGESRYGDTSLYFADCVGTRGEVHAIQPDVRNVSIIRDNCEANPTLGYQTIVTVGSLSDHSGDWISYDADGPLRLLLCPDPWERPLAKTPTVSIDDLIDRELITRVDFIKLDVRKMEQALRGARMTIEVFQPILAVSLSGDADDLVTLQPHLRHLADSYDFFLDHATWGSGAAVLFARPHSPRPRG